MATLQLQPPEPFDFKSPDAWPKWKRRFQQYQDASGLSGEPDARQVSTLLYCLGEEANDVLASTNISDADKKRFDKVMEKFDEFFNVRHNVIFERARFNQRNQLPGESAEKYIAELYRLADNCNYGTLKDEMIRDRLVVGILDKKTSQHLQMDPTLTVEKAKKTIRQKEAVLEQGRELEEKKHSESMEELEKTIAELRASMDELKRKPGASGQRGRRGSHFKRSGGACGGARSTPGCTRCGHDVHQSGERCPAAEATCHRCGRKGHFSRFCFSRTLAPVDINEVDPAGHELFLDAVNDDGAASWMVTLTAVTAGNKPVEFKVDTGAAVTAITEVTYEALKRPKLSPTSKILCGPAQQSLTVLGQFRERIATQDQSALLDLYVIKGLKTNLLGLQAITALHLMERLCTTELKSQDLKDQFPQVFTGLGTFGEEYEVKLKEDAKPFSLYAPRNVPIPQLPKVQRELERMQKLGVIRKVSEPTPWCAGMVVVPKRSGDIRICVDLKPLNESVLREVYPIPTVDDTLAQLTGAKIFSKLDANSGFWQIPLAKKSQLLTTFITPFGRFCYNKLPFGISSTPEVYQKRMNQILEGLPGVLCLIDDILIFGQDQNEHDVRLQAALRQLQEAGVTLNPEKCAFSQHSLKFLGHMIDEQGIRADPDKTAAIQDMSTPKSITDLRRFMGMVNQLGKFSHKIAELGQPLRACLSTKNSWTWGPDQDRAFSEVKKELTQPSVLALYNPKSKTKVAADASSFGLGAVLMQEQDDVWRPVSYASRAMSETERHYAQIEKEALAVTWACEKFRSYLLGLTFTIETDHKPLVPLLSTKCLNSLPPRLIRFRLRLSSFSYTIQHVPGKLLYTADTLSRAPITCSSSPAVEGVEEFVGSIMATLPASPHRLKDYCTAQKQDPTCQQIRQYCQDGWPCKEQVDRNLRAFWKVRGSFTVCEDMLLFNSRIVIPKSLQRKTLDKIHQGHQGIERCLQRIRSSVWWPGITTHLKQVIQNCHTCSKNARPRKEPLMTTNLPEYPWQVVGTDLFEKNGFHYLLTVDYFSRYPEVTRLATTTSTAVISALKAVFARHGIPEVVRSDNGPQYSSHEFAIFVDSYGFKHSTSSPHYPQSNGQAERMVQTVKRLMNNSSDLYMALLTYRATPLPWCGHSPAELCMGRQIRTTVPQPTRHLVPRWTYLTEFRQKSDEYKRKQKESFDLRHRVREASELPDQVDVWVNTGPEPVRGTVTNAAEQPRSYQVSTPSGDLRRNRSQLNVVPPTRETLPESPGEQTTPTSSNPSPSPRRIMTRSRTGTEVGPPDYWQC